MILKVADETFPAFSLVIPRKGVLPLGGLLGKSWPGVVFAVDLPPACTEIGW